MLLLNLSHSTSENKSHSNSTNSYDYKPYQVTAASRSGTHVPLNEVYQVTIRKTPDKKSFGFGLRGGKEYGLRLYILRLAVNGPADCTDPKILVGDRLLKINNQSCEEPDLMLHTTAIELIKKGGPVLRLTLVRGDGTVPANNGKLSAMR